jgi:hypothetical protein
MRPVPVVLALALFLAALPARAEPVPAPGLELPPVLPDVPTAGAPVLRPGQRGVVLLQNAGEKAATWDLLLRRGDRVALEVTSAAALALRAAPLPDDSATKPDAAVPAVEARSEDDGTGTFRARFEVRAPRKGTWRVAVRPAGEGASATHTVTVLCLEGPSCRGSAPTACGPDGHPWWLRRPIRLLSDPARFEGHPVRVRAKVRADIPRCTLKACPGKTCCNHCVSSLVTGPAGLRALPGMRDAGLRLEGLACRGRDCDWQQQCPFAPGDRVTAWGYLHGDDAGTRLEVHGACGPIPKAK